MAPNRRDTLNASNPIGLRNRPQVTFQESVSMFIKSEESTPGNAPGALVPLEDGSVQLGNFRLTPTGLVVNGTADEGEWSQVGGLLRRLEGSIQWLIGDWFVYAERNWGKTYEAIASETGYSEKTLRQYAWVASNVDLSVRTDKLTFGHHERVAGLDIEQQRAWLEWAVSQNASISQMRKAMQGEDNDPPTPPPGLPPDVVKKAPKMHRSMTRINAYVEGRLNFNQKDLQREVLDVITWMRKVAGLDE